MKETGKVRRFTLSVWTLHFSAFLFYYISFSLSLINCAVAKFAQEQIAPLVRDMEAQGKIDDRILKGLFENGFMGIEIPQEYGGAGSNFMTSILAVEEISKVDPAVAVLVDIQNTLINSLINRLGTKAQKEKYLTKLATESVTDKNEID